MSKGKRVELARGLELAEEVLKLINPHSLKREVVGSVRRAKPMIGDIEVLALAGEIGMSDLFGTEITVERTAIDEMVDNLAQKVSYEGWTPDGPNKGHKIKRLRHRPSGMTCEIYVVMDMRAWGPHMMVRTGPRLYSQHLMTTASAQGMHFANGFLLHNHMKTKSGCHLGSSCPDIIPLEHESDVFEILKLPVLTPEEREAEYGSGL